MRASELFLSETMSQQRVEDARKDHPYTDEARKRVLEWMANPENEDSELDFSHSEQSDRGSPVGDSRKVSIMGARIESESEGTKQGLTASRGGPSNRKGSTASQGGPANSRERVDSLPRYRPAFCSSDDLPKTGNRLPSPPDNSAEEPTKRLKLDSDLDSESAGPSGLTCFDPASLFKAREGTIKVSPLIKKYLSKYMKRCLSKEEREALFREHPRPDVDSCSPPKVDKYISEFLGKHLPKEHDAELAKIQSAVLAIIRPLTSAWQHLIDGGIEDDTEMVVPGSEVLALLQRTLCMIGNASELISQTRRSKILETVDRSWSKFGSDDFPSAKDTLFGEDFQSSLTSKVEKDTALSKAVAITKRSKREKETSTFSSKREGQRNVTFFRGGPPAKYGGRQGKSFILYSSHPYQNREGDFSRGRRFTNSHRQGQKPLYHEPKLPPDPNQKTPQRKF